MTLSPVRSIAAAAALLFIPGTYLSLRAVQNAAHQTGGREELYLSSPKILGKLSLGYNGLLSDIYWTRAVQYFGLHHNRGDGDYRLLKPLLDIASDLDPNLTVIYEVGSTFLAQRPPEGAGDPDAAAQLVEKGIRHNPNYWRLYYQLGFIDYLERHDYAAAERAFETGANVPGAHPWMGIMAALMARKAGDLGTSTYLWTNIYNSSEDPLIKQNALKRLAALQVDHDVPFLQNLVSQYRKRTGRNPATFQELIHAGLLTRVPVDPIGVPYKLVNGRVEVQDPSRLPFIREGLPPGQESSNFIFHP